MRKNEQSSGNDKSNPEKQLANGQKKSKRSPFITVGQSANKLFKVVVDTTKHSVFIVYCGACSLVGGISGFSIGMAVGGPICRYLSDLYYGPSAGMLAAIGRYASANIATQYGGVIFFGVLGELAGLAGGAYAGYKGAVLLGNISSKTWDFIAQKWYEKQDPHSVIGQLAKGSAQEQASLAEAVREDYFLSREVENNAESKKKVETCEVGTNTETTSQDFENTMMLFQYRVPREQLAREHIPYAASFHGSSRQIAVNTETTFPDVPIDEKYSPRILPRAASCPNLGSAALRNYQTSNAEQAAKENLRKALTKLALIDGGVIFEPCADSPRHSANHIKP